MTDPGSSEGIQDFNARHVFALFPDGGIALQLASGTYSSLNASAAAICRFIAESRSWEDAVSAVMKRWRMSDADARAALLRVRESLAGSQHLPGSTDGLISYQPWGDGYALVRRGQALVSLNRDGDHLRLLMPPASLPFSVEHCLRIVSPKILAARGRMVLHASSCLVRDKLTAFCGLSGAGKSTTARLLGSLGVPKVTDEVLLVSIADGRAFGHPEAEQHVQQWCLAGARTLEAQPDLALSCAGLSAAVDRPAVPLARLVFLDARARGASAFETEGMPPTEALKDILVAMFLARKDPASLRAFFERCRALASVVCCERARAPEGLAALADALAAYSSKMAS